MLNIRLKFQSAVLYLFNTALCPNLIFILLTDYSSPFTIALLSISSKLKSKLDAYLKFS